MILLIDSTGHSLCVHIRHHMHAVMSWAGVRKQVEPKRSTQEAILSCRKFIPDLKKRNVNVSTYWIGGTGRSKQEEQNAKHKHEAWTWNEQTT